MRKPQRPRAAAVEEEKVGASLSGGQRDQDDIPQVLPRRGSEGSPCDGIFTRELQGQNVENELNSTASNTSISSACNCKVI
ncbi:unnamed protein product [Urochloa humidicola]